MAKRAPSDIVNLKLRLPERLRAQLEKAARKGDRSLNSEIVARLDQSFTRPAMLDDIKNALRDLEESFVVPRLRADIASMFEEEARRADQKTQALDAALRQIEATFGKGSIRRLTQQPPLSLSDNLVVPALPKGSRQVAGTTPASHLQEGDQPATKEGDKE